MQVKSSPLLIIGFNRPVHMLQVFNEIKKARPAKLYIAIDGPRKTHLGDVTGIQQTIDIFKNIDWPCEVKKLFRNENLGCKNAVSSAISWFFENEEQGIILEDDCVPSASFFDYCNYLLEKYKDTETIMHINGVNFQHGRIHGTATYYFSKICHVWGWASWRRAWNKYDIKMANVEYFFTDGLYKSVVNYPTSLAYWSNNFYETKAGQKDTWDYQWVFSVWKNNGLAITPNVNLVSNIGFDALGTHTKTDDDKVGSMPVYALTGSIKDCNLLVPSYEADAYSFKTFFTVRKKNIAKRIKNKLIKTFSAST